MKKELTKPDVHLGLTNALSISQLVDKKVEPTVKEFEKKLKTIAKENKLYIHGLIWIENVS